MSAIVTIQQLVVRKCTSRRMPSLGNFSRVTTNENTTVIFFLATHEAVEVDGYSMSFLHITSVQHKVHSFWWYVWETFRQNLSKHVK